MLCKHCFDAKYELTCRERCLNRNSLSENTLGLDFFWADKPPIINKPLVLEGFDLQDLQGRFWWNLGMVYSQVYNAALDRPFRQRHPRHDFMASLKPDWPQCGNLRFGGGIWWGPTESCGRENHERMDLRYPMPHVRVQLCPNPSLPRNVHETHWCGFSIHSYTKNPKSYQEPDAPKHAGQIPIIPRGEGDRNKYTTFRSFDQAETNKPVWQHLWWVGLSPTHLLKQTVAYCGKSQFINHLQISPASP